MRHDSREGEVVGKYAHTLWKYCCGASAAAAFAILGFSVAGWFWHSWGESQHQSDIDEWDRAEREVAGEHPEDNSYVVIDLNKVTDIH